MPRIRRTDKVTKSQANLAYVGGHKISPSDVEVVPVMGEQQILDRRVMYGDIAGRLIDGSTGNPTVYDAYPVVTDMFYDKDRDRLLDAQEVYAHAALPFVFTTARPYLGPVASPTSDTYTYDAETELFLDEHPGRYATGSENISVVYEDGSPYDGNYHVLVERIAGQGIIGDLVDRDTQPEGPLDIEETEHDGKSAHRVWVHLDRDDVDLYVKYVAAEVVDVDGVWRPQDIDSDHAEYISSRPLYKYDLLTAVVDPINRQKRIVSSVKTPGGYNIYVPGAALVDDRQPDFFFWRLRAVFDRAVPTYAVEKDTIRVGTLGSTPTNLSSFLSGDTQDYMTKRKVSFINPRPFHGQPWQAYINFAQKFEDVIKQMLEYDVLIHCSSRMNWLAYGTYYRAFMARGGTLVIDIDGVRTPEHIPRAGSDDLDVVLGEEVFANLYFDERDSISKEIKTASLGYDITDSEIDTMTYAYNGTDSGFHEVLTKIFVPAGSSSFNIELGATPRYAIATGETTKITDFNTAIGGIASFAADPAKSYTVYISPDSGRIVWGGEKGQPCAMYAKNMSNGGRLIVSGMGLFHLPGENSHQLVTNILLSAGRRDSGNISGSLTTRYTITTPWTRDWVLGVDEHGKPVLSDSELEDYRYTMVYDQHTGIATPRRALSGRAIREIVRTHTETDPDARGIVLPSDGITYYLEIASDSGYVKGTGEVNGAEPPTVWTTRVTNNFIIPDGWRLGRFTKDETENDVPPIVDNSRPFSGALMARYEAPTSLDISFSTSIAFEYYEYVTKTVEKTVDNSSGILKSITTWSDIEWHAIHGGDPTGDRNLWSWGGVTKYRWYPWDGQTMLLSTARGSTGDDVRFIQNALNKVHAIGRGSSHSNEKNPYLPLTVDGRYGSRTESAVTWYQGHWLFTADGDIDAGTCGHLLRNYKDRTNDPSLDERWRQYGPLENMLDGRNDTHHGRRSWVNMASNVAMSDSIIIALNSPLRITDVRIKPNLSGTAADCLRITKLGAALGSTISWDIDGSVNASDGEYKTLDMRDRDVDRLFVHLTQDHSFYKNSKMWAFTHLIFHGTTTTTVQERKSKTVDFPINNVTFTIAGDTPWVYEWTPDYIKHIGSENFIAYTETAQQIADKISASIEALHPGYMQHFSVKVTINGTRIRVEIAHKDAHVPLATVTNIAVSSGVATVTTGTGEALNFADVNESLDGVAVINLVGTASDLNGFNKTITVTASNTFTFPATGHADVAGYATSGVVGMIVLSPEWSDSLLESETLKTTDYSSEIDTLVSKINVIGENWRVMISPLTTGGSNDVAIVIYDKLSNQMFTEMTLNEFRERRGTIALGAVARSTEAEDPDAIKATVYPKLYAMRPYGVILRGAQGVFGVGGVVGEELDEVWGLEIATGEIDKTFVLPSQSDFYKNTTSPLVSYLLSFQGRELTAHYEVVGGPYDGTSKAPYVTYTSEIPIISDDRKEIQLHHHPVAYLESGTPRIAVTVNGSAKTDIVAIDPDEGTVAFATAIAEGATVTVTYTVLERSTVYYGAKDSFGTTFFDICPLRGHKTTFGVTNYDAMDLLGRQIYVYAYPTYFTNGDQVIKPTTIRTGLLHTLTGSIFDKNSKEFDPFAMLIATVTMKAIDPSTSVIVDARSGGGGIDDDNVAKAMDITSEVEGFFDIGHMDGDAYLPGGTVVVELPSEWKTTWEGLGVDNKKLSKMIEKTFAKVVPAGKTAIILWSDGTVTYVGDFDFDDFDFDEFA